MKKAVLYLLFFGGSSLAIAQSATSKSDLQKSKLDNEAKLEKFIQRNSDNFSREEIEELKSKLASFAGNIPVFWEDDDKGANRSANVTVLQDGSLSGLNSVPVDGSGINFYVFDGGRVHDTHNEFGGAAANPKRVVNMEATTVAKSSHATNVTSIILGDGDSTGTINWSDGTSNSVSDAQGVLTKATSNNYAFASTALGDNYQKLEAATEANVSNHSYGINLGWAYRTSPTTGWYWVGNYELNHQDTYSGSYYTNDQKFDQIVYSDQDHIVVKSAGNYYGYGPDDDPSLPKFKYNNATGTYVAFAATDELPPSNCSLGYNCIGWGSLAKNVIVVGATYQLETADNIYTDPTDVLKADFSSAGPRKDGAIKPDISAVGVAIVSATYSSSNPSSNGYYTKGNGTSYAAPVVAGIAGALTQVQRNLTSNATFTFKADEMKALLTHTANEAGNTGPDVWYGWGFADATNGAELLIDKAANKAIFERNSLSSGVVYSKEVYGKTGESLKASISWVDPAATPFTTDVDLQSNNSSRLINDLDLRIIDTTDNTVYYPWKLDISNPMASATKGDNLVDNVEQVLLESPVAGRKYRVEVSNKGTLVDDTDTAAPQNYALIVTGYDETMMSTTEINGLKGITVYPTKTKDYVNVVIPVKAENLSVYDLSGKQVLNITPKGSEMVDLSSLPKGVYIFSIKTVNGSVSKKVIKE